MLCFYQSRILSKKPESIYMKNGKLKEENTDPDPVFKISFIESFVYAADILINKQRAKRQSRETDKLFSCFRWCSCLQTEMNNSEFPSVKTGVRNLSKKIGKKALTWTIIYFWGYFGLGLGWLSVPLMLSILRWFSKLYANEKRRSPFKRYQRRKETQFKISSAQSLATADEKEVRRENVVLCDDNKNN